MIRHTNIFSGKYILDYNKPIEEFIIELVASVFGHHSEVFDVMVESGKITFKICNRNANYYVRIIDSIDKTDNFKEISYYLAATY
jgi:hypothetical protein